MKKDKILISIFNLDDIEKYKKIGINNFLFAIKDYSVCINSFNLEEIKYIKCNKYIYINKIFNTNDCDNFKLIINKLSFAEGIIFEDPAVYQLLKDTNIKLIWNQIHFQTNYESINYWLEMVYSSCISNELTFDEINDILQKTTKPLILNVFGYNNIMYSRRNLLTNFQEYFNLPSKKESILYEPITKNEFLIKEDNNGTQIFNNEPFNIIKYINKLNDNKILYYYVNTFNSDFETICNVINGNSIGNEGFINKKTIYKLGEKK